MMMIATPSERRFHVLLHGLLDQAANIASTHRLPDEGEQIAAFCYRHGIETVDLAFLPNIPTILQVLDGILDEMAIEGVILASEIKEWAPEMDAEYAKRWPAEAKVTYIPHSEFDEEIKHVKAVIRTGQFGLHAPNIILQAGCVY